MSEQTPTTIALEAADSSPHTGETVAPGRELVPVPADSFAPACTPVEINSPQEKFAQAEADRFGPCRPLVLLVLRARKQRGPLSFKETDVKRAIRSVIEAGLQVAGVEINPKTGSIMVHAGKPGELPVEADEPNPWDDKADETKRLA